VVIANVFGISSGSVFNCTKRFAQAVKELTKDFIVWPSAQRHRQLAAYV